MSGLGDMLGNPFGGDASDLLAKAAAAGKASAAAKAKDNPAKPLPQIRGKRFDGVLYVHAGDVADALASQAPKQNERLIKKLRGAS